MLLDSRGMSKKEKEKEKVSQLRKLVSTVVFSKTTEVKHGGLNPWIHGYLPQHHRLSEEGRAVACSKYCPCKAVVN